MPTRPFGRSGVNVPILSLGGMFDIPNNQLLMRQAVKWGVTYWDTANSYEGGHSEKGIGKYFARYPEDRKKIFLVTKSTAWTKAGMTEHLDLSLERMQTDAVDLFFVHAVRSASSMDADMRQWAEKAKSQGKIRLFGFSTHSNMEQCLLGGARLGWIDGIMMTYNYRIMHEDGMRRAVEACVKAGIGLTAMKTQGGGQVLTGGPEEIRIGGRFLQGGFTQGQAKLKAVWENPQISAICAQMPTMALLSENTAAARRPHAPLGRGAGRAAADGRGRPGGLLRGLHALLRAGPVADRAGRPGHALPDVLPQLRRPRVRAQPLPARCRPRLARRWRGWTTPRPRRAARTGCRSAASCARPPWSSLSAG